MYVVCDPILTLENAYWYNGSYVDSLRAFFSRNSCKDALVFRDVRAKGRCSDLQFVALVKRKNLSKLLSNSPRA